MSNRGGSGRYGQYQGTNAVQPPNWNFQDRDPNQYDSLNYSLGDMWLNQNTSAVFILTSLEGNSSSKGELAQWSNFGSGTGAVTFTTDAGTATTSGSNIFDLGDGLNITTSGSGSTVTTTLNPDITVNSVTATNTITSINGDISSGGDISAVDAIVAGTTITAGTGMEIISGTLTIDGFGAGVVQSDASGVLFSDNGANGELLIGGGAAPAWANITSLGGSVTITNGANSINLEAGTSTPTTFTADSGTATPAMNNINIIGGTNIVTSASGSSVTIDLQATVPVSLGGTGATTFTTNGVLYGNGTSAIQATAAGTTGQVLTNSAGTPVWGAAPVGVTWVEVTGTSQAMAINTGYIANNAGLVTLTLPSTAAVGSIIEVVGKGTGLYSIAQNSGQTIHFGASATTGGVGGSITATNQYDAIRLVCITADTTFAVLSAQGNLTVV